MAIRLEKKPLSRFTRHFLLVLSGLAVIVLSACVTQIPGKTTAEGPAYRVYANPYDAVWAVVTSVMQNEGLSLDIVDKDSGILNGIKDLEPSTLDMLMSYSVRIRTSVTLRRVEGNYVEVKISSKEERKYEERGWRPARDASSYSTALFDAFDSQLTVRSVAATPGDSGPVRIVSEKLPEQNSRPMTREEIREAQRLLNALGHQAGTADGIPGPKTTAAISSFQQVSGIPANGALDKQTLDALRHAAPTAAQAESFPVVERSPSNNVDTEDGLRQTDSPVSVPSASARASVRTSYALAETELKASADPFSSTIATIGKGGQLRVLRDDGEWLHVQYGDREGYIFSEFVAR